MSSFLAFLNTIIFDILSKYFILIVFIKT